MTGSSIVKSHKSSLVHKQQWQSDLSDEHLQALVVDSFDVLEDLRTLYNAHCSDCYSIL